MQIPLSFLDPITTLSPSQHIYYCQSMDQDLTEGKIDTAQNQPQLWSILTKLRHNRLTKGIIALQLFIKASFENPSVRKI